MKKLKFSKDEGSEFYKEFLAEVEQYFSNNKIRKKGNTKMIIKIILYFGLVGLFYALMMMSNNQYEFFVFYVLLGVSVLLTAFNISHDAAHGVAVKNKFWNKLMFSISFNLLGNNAYVWGKNHNESHHLYTNVEGSDIDVLNNPLLRMTENQPLKWFHKFQYLYAPFLYLFYSLNWCFFREALMLFKFSSRTIRVKIPTNEVIKLILHKISYIVYMLVLPIYLLSFSWQTVLIVFLLSHFIISLFFVAVLGVSHLSDFVLHPVPDASDKLNMSWTKLQMCTSVDYNPDSTFFNWTLGGFNAHTIHHLLPGICHVHYINILPIFRKLTQKYNLVYLEMPYKKSLAAHFRFLKGMGNYTSFKPTHYER